jgi:hypothetical protein
MRAGNRSLHVHTLSGTHIRSGGEVWEMIVEALILDGWQEAGLAVKRPGAAI